MADTQSTQATMFVPVDHPSQAASQLSLAATTPPLNAQEKNGVEEGAVADVEVGDADRPKEPAAAPAQPKSLSARITSKLTRSEAEDLWSHLVATIKPTLLAESELIILTVFTGLQGESSPAPPPPLPSPPRRVRLSTLLVRLVLTALRRPPDAVSFPDYHCFASNQTGNTIFLVLALILPELNGVMFITANIGAALGFFLVAGWMTGQIGHIVGPRCRLWLIGINMFQAALVFAAGAIQYVYGVEREGGLAIAVIALLAFASGSQVVQSRSLAMTEISTAMATAAWVDLLIDPRLFVLKNRPRNRRVVFLFSLITGALLGAILYRSAGSSVAIFISATGKLVVALLYFFNKTEPPKTHSPV